jgi:hypothetical protein
MDGFQGLIHRLEVGGGMRYLRIGLAVLALLFLAVLYDTRGYRNMGSQEAMDAAQLARNFFQGKGYTTLFIRPLSLNLVSRCNERKRGPAEPGRPADYGCIRDAPHPDIANAPLYPAILAGLMKAGSWLEHVPLLKVCSFQFVPDSTGPFWSERGVSVRYQPDFLITLFNQFLFLLVIVSVFLLARRLFEVRVAWLSALLVLGTDLLWRFSTSGLSTMLLLLIFMGLAWCIVLLEEETREPKWHPVGVFVLAGAAGLLVGLGGLTRYSFGLLMLPVVVFIMLTTGRQRWILGTASLLAFAAILAPWLFRNYSICGKPFGTASYAVLEATFLFPQNTLPRSIEPDLKLAIMATLKVAWSKMLLISRPMLQTELPKLGGSWVSGFFMVGLLMGFKNPAVRRLRYFVVGCLAVLTVAQALVRTQNSEDVAEVNSENLLVLVAPLVLVFGVSFFYFLFEQIYFPFRQLRTGALGLFCAVTCLPLILTLLPPKTNPLVFPPYYPGGIYKIAGWTKPNELIMSDIPWAVAWYGQRQCIWLSQNAPVFPRDPSTATTPDFFKIHDYQKPISLVYLTSVTMDSKLLATLNEQNWGRFVLNTVVNDYKVPENCPLRKIRGVTPPPQVVLTDWERWRLAGD